MPVIEAQTRHQRGHDAPHDDGMGYFVEDGILKFRPAVREDRSALWLRLPDESHVSKALRVLANGNYVHTRYYGSGKQEDFASRRRQSS
jgi:hypothetical protein